MGIARDDDEEVSETDQGKGGRQKWKRGGGSLKLGEKIGQEMRTGKRK